VFLILKDVNYYVTKINIVKSYIEECSKKGLKACSESVKVPYDILRKEIVSKFNYILDGRQTDTKL
jgi:hypothetical protein